MTLAIVLIDKLQHEQERSQTIGGVVGGIGMALREHTLMNDRYGRFMNANLGEYLVPLNADIGEIEAYFVGEPDYHANPLGAKGIGEIAIVDVVAAIASGSNVKLYYGDYYTLFLPVKLFKSRYHVRLNNHNISQVSY